MRLVLLIYSIAIIAVLISIPEIIFFEKIVYYLKYAHVVKERLLIKNHFKHVYNFNFQMSEYLKNNDYNTGFILVLDYRNINILNFVTKISPVDLRQIVMLITVSKYMHMIINMMN